ncbi:MAG: hypothetical protein AAF320_02220 [Myxococcota bacterium]
MKTKIGKIFVWIACGFWGLAVPLHAMQSNNSPRNPWLQRSVQVCEQAPVVNQRDIEEALQVLRKLPNRFNWQDVEQKIERDFDQIRIVVNKKLHKHKEVSWALRSSLSRLVTNSQDKIDPRGIYEHALHMLFVLQEGVFQPLEPESTAQKLNGKQFNGIDCGWIPNHVYTVQKLILIYAIYVACNGDPVCWKQASQQLSIKMNYVYPCKILEILKKPLAGNVLLFPSGSFYMPHAGYGFGFGRENDSIDRGCECTVFCRNIAGFATSWATSDLADMWFQLNGRPGQYKSIKRQKQQRESEDYQQLIAVPVEFKCLQAGDMIIRRGLTGVHTLFVHSKNSEEETLQTVECTRGIFINNNSLTKKRKMEGFYTNRILSWEALKQEGDIYVLRKKMIPKPINAGWKRSKM